MPKTNSKTKLALDDFCVISYVPWRSIREVLGTKNYARFMDWIEGQSTFGIGVYPKDLERFLEEELKD